MDFATAPGSLNGPALDFFAITPSDATNFPFTVRGIYVGVTGDIVAVNAGGGAILFKNAVQGTILPVKAIRVNSSSTTATTLVGLY